VICLPCRNKLSLYPSRFYMPRSCPYTLPGFTCPDLVPITFQVLHAQILSLYPSSFYMPRSYPYNIPGFTCPDHKTPNYQKRKKSTTQSFYICLHDAQSLQMKKKELHCIWVKDKVFNATYFSYIVAVSFIGGGNQITGENH